mmetsp:Transcript_26341/g.66238  ORF Transcript_26341/g.66238 Transcript_26341/m.66238 type:complete len:236 (+) Transcript_26341:123-830(+)
MNSYLTTLLALTVLVLGVRSHSFVHPPRSLHSVSARSDSVSVPGESPFPFVTSIYPVMGPPSSYLYIMGRNFNESTAVRFVPEGVPPSAAVALSVVFYSEAQIAVTVPNTAHTVVNVMVETAKGRALESPRFIVASPVQAPVLSRLSSNQGAVGCYNYVDGDNFVLGQTNVTVGPLPVSVVFYSYRELGFVVPSALLAAPGATTSGLPVTVTTPYGSVTSSFRFVVIPGSSTGFC